MKWAWILFFLFGCAYRESGFYVRTSPKDTWPLLSKRYQTPLLKLKALNLKRRPSNNWIFVPLNKRPLQVREKVFKSNLHLAWPVPTSKRVSSYFGPRKGRAHEGIDIPAHSGRHIVAADDGVVVYSGRGLSGYGNLTVLEHRYGFFTVYAHAKKNYVKKGQTVSKGQVIALVGQTGRTTGPHLHFEVRYNSRALDPLQFYSFARR